MHATVRSLSFLPDPTTLPDDPAEFAFLARLLVGPSDGDGEESFDVQVCTPEWLGRRCQVEGFVSARHTIVTTIDTYSELALREFVTKQVESASGSTWRAVADRVARIGLWEFEDYTDR